MKTRTGWFCGLLALAGSLAADDAQTRTAARAALTRYKDAVITVRLTVKSRMVYQGQQREGTESTMEIAGTILSASGLTAVSDFSSNPAGLSPTMPGGPKVETETTDVKLVLSDGRELAAHFVLRDQDLDMAFLVPDEKAEGLSALTLEKGTLPEPMDDLVLLYPLGKSLSRVLAVSTPKLRAVVRKPRVFLVTDMLDSLQSLGCPAFDATGRALGLVVLRRSAVPSGGDGGLRQILDMVSPVVLTAEDVLPLAAQAATAAAKPTVSAKPLADDAKPPADDAKPEP